MRSDQPLVRTIFPSERENAIAWVGRHFGSGWASEFEYAASQSPVSAYIAIEHCAIIGFACFDATARGVFGPTGVSEAERGRGIGTALLIRALSDMRAMGYVYAVIGAAGPTEYYKRTVGAHPIEGGAPGFLETLIGRC